MNHKTNDRCQLKFLPYSYFSKEVARKVSRGRWSLSRPAMGLTPMLVLPVPAGDRRGE